MSEFDWRAIAGPLLQAGSTALGTLVGGPAGAMVGNAVGPILADALGVPATPAAVGAAIEANPGAVAQVERDRSDELRAAIEAATTQHLAIVNETYRLEMQSDDLIARIWRPAFGLCFCGVWTLHGLAIGYALFQRDYGVVARIPDLTVFYGVAAAVCGVYAWRRTTEKLAGVASPNLGGVIGGVAGAVLARVGKK